METCCCCCLTGCQWDWKKAQWVCLGGCGGMDNSFAAGRGMLKWPFYCSQMPATSALTAQEPAQREVLWPVLGQEVRSSAPLQPPSQLSAWAGWPPTGQASHGSPLGWRAARAIVLLLLFVHHPQDWQLHSYGIIIASSVGNRNKAQYWHWKTADKWTSAKL